MSEEDIQGSRSRDIGYGFVDFRRPGFNAIELWVEGTASGIGGTAQAQKERGPGFVGTQ